MEALIYEYLSSASIFVLAFVIVAMLYILSKGADMLVDGAVKISLQWGISKMVIGATIVSLGTTLPEATVSVLAAVNGNSDLALGNAVGSIIVNTGLIIGLAALIGRLPVDPSIVEGQGKFQVGVGIFFAIISLPFFSGGNGKINQWVGWLLILLLIVYIYYSIKRAKNKALEELTKEDENTSTVAKKVASKEILVEKRGSVTIQIIELFIGILLVIGSSKILIPAVEISAFRVGIPQSIIAATLVALGTSLPELVTAITAVRKGHGELAIGNIVGADILNILFVIGGAASVTKGGLDVSLDFYKLQIPTMLIILIVFRMFTKGKDKEINKKQGLVLLIIYTIYIILNFTWF